MKTNRKENETINQYLCRVFKVRYQKRFDEESRPVVTERQRAIENKKMELLKSITQYKPLSEPVDENYREFYSKKLKEASTRPDGKQFKQDTAWIEKLMKE